MTDLTDRMRTCAAFLLSCDLLGDLELRHDMVEHAAVKDAADLLIEASNVLEVTPVAIEAIEKLTEQPMEIIEPPPPGFSIDRTPSPAWTTKRNPRACPRCDSRASKRARREGNMLMLECPVCSETWEWRPA